jgi:hypothetical protein
VALKVEFEMEGEETEFEIELELVRTVGTARKPPQLVIARGCASALAMGITGAV